MPYLQVDLDGKRRWPMVAAGLKVSEGAVAKGFLDLWEMCWRDKSDRIGVLRLEMLFEANGERVAAVLTELGFLEPLPDGLYRVKGAEKRLGVYRARSEAGRRNAGNLVQNRAKTPPGDPEVDPEVHSGRTSESTPGLTPNTQHPTPKTYIGADAPHAEVFELRPQEPQARKQRAPSKAEALYAKCEASRRDACAAAGVDFTDEEWPPVRQNKQLGPIAKADAATQSAFEAAWDAYLSEGANVTRDPPFSLGYFMATRSTWASRAKRAGGAA